MTGINVVTGTMLRSGDYVMLADQSHVVIESIEGDEARAYDEHGWRNIRLADVVHLEYNVDDYKPDDKCGH